MISRMEFRCKLAHNDQVKMISGFNSIKELYERVSQVFTIPINDILFCTLNTHDFRDMNSLLGNYLCFGDLIVVHICGSSRDLAIEKTQQYLGLTITDNGHGRAFVKKVNSEQDSVQQLIKPGDHIAAINSNSTIGLRHYEVAKALRELRQGTTFTLHLLEPLHSEDYLHKVIKSDGVNSLIKSTQSSEPCQSVPLLSFINTENQRQLSNHGSTNESNNEGNQPLKDFQLSHQSYEELAKSSLPIDRLLSKSANNDADIQENHNLDDYRRTIERINSILESFLGINDNALAVQIYRLAKDNRDSFSMFVEAIEKSELSSFNFGHDIETNLWNSAIGTN